MSSKSGPGFCAECGGQMTECRALVIVAAPGTWDLVTPLKLRCDTCGKSADVAGYPHTTTLRPKVA